MIKKKILKILLIILIVIAALVIFFYINYFVKSNRSTASIGKVKTHYTCDGSESKIKNIPYSKYINDCKTPANCIVPKISENNTGEDNAAQIKNAMDSLGKTGGTVYIPKGKYKISTLRLKSNITLFVSKEAELISLSCDEKSKSNTPIEGGVISAKDAKNITVTGGGVINGNGVSYTSEPENEKPFYALKEFNTYTRVIEARKRIRFKKDGVERNYLLNLKDCENVKINNIILRESANWTLVIDGGNNFEIKNTVIDNNMHVANTDGIDLLNCANVKISKCFIATGDDGIVLKPTENNITDINIKDCEICSFANCFKIGTETAFDVNGVNVNDCRFFIPDGLTYGYSGIAIESADGGKISNVNVKGIDMDGVSSPILIWLGSRLNYDRSEPGSIDNVIIENVIASNTEMPSAITGCKFKGKIYSIGKVTLNNINVKYRDTGENLSAQKPVINSGMKGYPEITRVSHYYFINHKYSVYRDLPCYGVFKRYCSTDTSHYKCTPRSCSTRDSVYTAK